MDLNDKIEAIEGATELIEEGLGMIREFADEDPNFKAYVFDQIAEHVSNSNPYNQSLDSVLQRLIEQSMLDYG